MSDQVIKWHHFKSDEVLLGTLLEQIDLISGQSINHKGSFHMVLAGGTTPETLYRQLVNLQTDWSRWHIYFGDERCLPKGDPDRNDTMTRNAWLRAVAIPEEQIHSIPAELGAEQGAIHYRQIVASVVQFDLVLLGVGEDGHTASLFPGDDPGDTTDYPDVLAVIDAPKLPPERISLSASRLSRAVHVWILATGEGKRAALESLKRGEELPVSTIAPQNGVDLFTDLVL